METKLPIFLVAFLTALFWIAPPLTHSEAPSFTIETLTGQKAHVPLGVRVAGNSLIITEPVSLPNPCYWVGAAVQRRDFEISVKLQPKENLSTDQTCAQMIVEAVARLPLPLPNGAYSILIETPQKTTRATARRAPKCPPLLTS